MGGCRCSYRHCPNTTKTRDNLHFFHYPVKQKERCKRWIENAGKPAFYDLDEEQLRNKVICETHFEDCYFPNQQKKRLLQNAIPTLDGDSPKCTENGIKFPEVLPANADGTLFVLETRPPAELNEEVESYVYTQNGVMMPMKTMAQESPMDIIDVFSDSEEGDVQQPRLEPGPRFGTPISISHFAIPVSSPYPPSIYSIPSTPHSPATSCRTPVSQKSSSQASEGSVYSQATTRRAYSRSDTQSTVKTTKTARTKSTETDYLKKLVEGRYIEDIKRNTKDIAELKKIIRRQYVPKPTMKTVMNMLRSKLAPSLFTIVKLNLNAGCLHFGPEERDFFRDFQATSPEAYDLLKTQYRWYMPNVDLLKTVNGDVE